MYDACMLAATPHYNHCYVILAANYNSQQLPSSYSLLRTFTIYDYKIGSTLYVMNKGGGMAELKN